ncbi:MAG: RagB/SusD family nutrient uptake outer membrane protein, partial [Sphingobacteriaceae bacterium]
MKYKNFKYGVATGVAAIYILFSSCNKDVLDRPPIDEFVDNDFWRSEDDLRLHANGFYTNYFVGYNSSFGLEYAPVRGYNFSDDLTGKNVQSAFESSVPSSRSGTTEAYEWMAQYGGPTWNFAWVRRANTFLDRIENVTKPKISTESYNHWTAVGRFFRGYEYSRLVSVFGDVPYFDRVVQDTEFDVLYKDRDNRGIVMDKVYDDFKFVLANIRQNDGVNVLNRDIAAAFISRLMLYEGTFLHYHGLDAARSKKYLEFAVEAAEMVMGNSKYSFTSDFKSLFASESLASNPEVIMYRVYDAALGITHAITSYQNGTESVGFDGNLVLIKSFLANDGKVYQNSTVPDVNSFAISDLVRTRDPRFEASFYDKPLATSATLLYGFKFAPREALTFIGKTYPPSYGSNTNTSDAPVIRLAEVVLNWIEAKAVLAQYHGAAAVTQDDLNKSVNA